MIAAKLVNYDAPQALLKVTLKKIPTLELVLDYWWAHQDLNLGPKDYAYHYSFHCLLYATR